MSLAEWKEKEKEQRRNYIIDAAQKLLTDKTFEDVSMNEIAREVGLGKSTLYLYFKNKESLYFAVCLRGIQIWAEMIRENIDKGNTGFEKLLLYLNTSREFSSNYPDYFRLLYSPTAIKKEFDMDKMNSSAEFREVKELFKEIMSIGIDLIQNGVDEGELRSDINPTEAMILLSVIFNGTVNMGDWAKDLLDNKGISGDKFNNDIGDLFLNMLVK